MASEPGCSAPPLPAAVLTTDDRLESEGSVGRLSLKRSIEGIEGMEETDTEEDRVLDRVTNACIVLSV